MVGGTWIEHVTPTMSTERAAGLLLRIKADRLHSLPIKHAWSHSILGISWAFSGSVYLLCFLASLALEVKVPSQA
jgi:hypothetical protein